MESAFKGAQKYLKSPFLQVRRPYRKGEET